MCKIFMWDNLILGTQDYSSLHGPWPVLIWMWNSFNFTFSICGLSFTFHFSCGNRNWRDYNLYLKETFFFSIQWRDIFHSSVLFLHMCLKVWNPVLWDQKKAKHWILCSIITIHLLRDSQVNTIHSSIRGEMPWESLLIDFFFFLF